MGRKWVTAEQKAWLQARVPQYLELESKVFHEETMAAWEATWPTELTAEEREAAGEDVKKTLEAKKTKGQFLTWFRVLIAIPVTIYRYGCIISFEKQIDWAAFIVLICAETSKSDFLNHPPIHIY